STASATCSWCAARCRARAARSWRCEAMPDAPLLGAGEKVSLDEEAFGARFAEALVHQSVRAEQAARRRGTASTRRRGVVSASVGVSDLLGAASLVLSRPALDALSARVSAQGRS